MSENHQRPTIATDVALPVEIVTLTRLRTKDGQPVQVQCEAVDELVATESYGLPGARVPSESESTMTRREKIAAALAKAPPAIHAGTVLLRADGSEVRPAFHCDEAHAVPGSIPWRLLSVPDKLRVYSGVMRQSGYGGADEERFPGADDGRSVHVVGALEGGESAPEVTPQGVEGP